MAYLQRLALNNYSLINFNDFNNEGHYAKGSIPSGKCEESYILETQERKKYPGFKDYIYYRIKKLRNNEMKVPSFSTAKKNQNNYVAKKLPKIINIKRSQNFQFHVFHDQHGYVKEMDKKKNRGLKMTRDKIRDLRIMSKINKLKDPSLTNSFNRAIRNNNIL